LRYLQAEVEKLGRVSYPSQTNFFLVDVHGDATALYEAMLYQGVIIRSMKPYGYASMVRITVGTEEENERFLRALALCLDQLGYR
jgi:histidinol-phosphate aminotransferase